MQVVQPRQQGGQLGATLFAYRREFQAQADARFYVAHDGVHADGTLLNEKMKIGGGAHCQGLERFNEKTSRAKVEHARNVFAPMTLPIDPNLAVRVKP